MTFDHAVATGLGILAFASYLGLFLFRAHHDRDASRLLFIDLLLVIAAAEIVADDARWDEVAIVLRGAFLAGGMALLITRNRGW